MWCKCSWFMNINIIKKNTKFDSIISIALSNVILNNRYFIRSKNSKMYE